MKEIEQHRIKNWFEWVRYEDGHHSRRLLTYRDAIPIEWINEWLNTGRNSKYLIPILEMIKGWEKENEAN